MSNPFFSIFLLCLVLPSAALAGRAEYVLGGENGNPWSAPLQEAAGLYQVFGPDGQVVDDLLVYASGELVFGRQRCH